jgi:hypothetical protein
MRKIKRTGQFKRDYKREAVLVEYFPDSRVFWRGAV